METSPAHSWRARLGPETVALAMSIALVLLVATTTVVAPGLLDALQSSDRGSTPRTAPSAVPPVDGRPTAALIGRGVDLNARIVANGDRLARLIAMKPVPVPEIVEELRAANVNLRFARAWTDELSRAPSGGALSAQLTTVYEALRRRIDDALDRPLYDGKGYRADALPLVDELRGLAAFEAGLMALLED